MKQAKHMFIIVLAAVGVIAAMMMGVKFAFSRMVSAAKPQLPAPIAPMQPAEVRVKVEERNAAPLENGAVVAASDAVAVVCGADEATAGRYETRNGALRAIARRRDLPKEDIAALVDYLRTADSALRVERVAALKNDVMNLLRSQEPPPANLAEALIAMFDGGGYPPAVLDYCIQHLGAMQNGIADDALRRRVHDVLVKAARRKSMPYAGTAQYSLAADRRATSAQNAELKRLALALCKPSGN